MVFINCLFMFGYGIIFFASRHTVVPKKWNISKAQFVFYKIAIWSCLHIQKITCKEWKLFSKETEEDLVCLEPASNATDRKEKYKMEKWSLLLMMIFILNLLLIVVWVSGQFQGELINQNTILRNSYHKGTKEIQLQVDAEPILKKEMIQIEVEEQKYTDEYLEQLYPLFIKELDEIILFNNTSLDQVSGDLNLVKQVEGYPYTVEWECSDYSLINADGTLGKRQVLEEGEIVELTGKIQYMEWEKSYLFGVYRVPPKLSGKEILVNKILKQIENQKLETETEVFLKLPTKVDQQSIRWKEFKKDNSMLILCLGVLTMVLMYVGKDRELHKKVDLRNKQMKQDYSEIISKLSLYMGAGMTIRTSFQKIAYDYLDKKKEGSDRRYAYEEMVITCYEIESGVAEQLAYENFAKRCKVPCYLKFGTLLSQNLKKGSKGLIAVLTAEAKSAFDDRKSMARRLGEEAGTKLLVPMMLMLAIVMIVIMVPAFMSFSI